MSASEGNAPVQAGVVGWPVSHSLSPRLHGYWLKKYQLEGSYEPLAVEPKNLPAFLAAMGEKNLRGVNLTLPHKELALPLMQSLDDAARHIGAVNMVTRRDDGSLHGRNTDAYGFMHNLRAKSGHRPFQRAVVLGAGGAARAVVYALVREGAGVTLVNRTRDKADTIAAGFAANVRVVDWDGGFEAISQCDLLVQTTSLGMKGQPPLEVPLESLPQTAWVTDIVYSPEPTDATRAVGAPTFTDLLARAQLRGNPVVEGLGMLLYQAQPAFEAWYGVRPEVTEELFDAVSGGLV